MNLNYKKLLIFIISILIVFTILFTLIFILLYNSKTKIVSSKKVYSIPNVTENNTVLEISSTEENQENITIIIKDKLKSYDLYYYIKTDSSDSENNLQNYSLLENSIFIDQNCTIYFKYKYGESFSDNNYELVVSNIAVPELVVEEKISETELKKETVDKKEVVQSTSPYYIKVNYGANVVTIYGKDSEGNYTVPVKAMICSCGDYTPHSGVYKTSDKYRWGKLIHNSYGQYSTRIVRSILFHSVPYNLNSNDSLQYEEFDKLGTTASAGCVRLMVVDSKWIYDNCPKGTMVEFYSDSNPGPLGKPTAPKISSNEECRNWDPTDPNEANPWRNRNKQNENTEKNNSNNDENKESSVDSTTTISDTITNNITNNTISVNDTETNSIANNSVSINSTVTNNITDNSISINNTVNTSTLDNKTISNSTISNNVIYNNIS